MNLRLLSFAAFAFLAVSAVHAENYDYKDVVSRSGAFEANGEVVLENVSGDIEIHTWNKNEISVEAEKSAKTEEELKLIELKIDLSNSAAAIKVILPKRPGGLFGSSNIRAAVRFKLYVPVTTQLKKISVVNSSVSVEGVRGLVNASSVNGAIRTTGLGGPVKLDTVNGAIKAQFDSVAAEQSLSFSTVNGRVVVSLPKDAGVELRTSVVNGRVECDFPLESGRKTSGKNVSGKIGDGRASLKAETVNGSVRIESQ